MARRLLNMLRRLWNRTVPDMTALADKRIYTAGNRVKFI